MARVLLLDMVDPVTMVVVVVDLMVDIGTDLPRLRMLVEDMVVHRHLVGIMVVAAAAVVTVAAGVAVPEVAVRNGIEGAMHPDLDTNCERHPLKELKSLLSPSA